MSDVTAKLAHDLRAAANYIDTLGGVSTGYRQTLAAYEAAQAEPVELRRDSAESTLQRLGYQWCGGELWKPPIGKAPAWLAAPVAQAEPRKPLTEQEANAICYVGPVYAPDGVVTRTTTAYRQELEAARLHGIREAERAHGIGASARGSNG